VQEKIKNTISTWTNPPFDTSTIDEINNLINKKDDKELNDRFYKQLEFGTGGLRGIIGAGTNRMNIYTVGMASQGLANYINSNSNADNSVVIARDSRNMSEEFAKETASILCANGIKVYFFDEITPVPLASFAIRHLGSIAGVVITASHNPPEYNGYKVFWNNGAQVTPPHDKGIIDEVKKTDNIKSIKKTDFMGGVEKGIIRIIGDEITDEYLLNLESSVLREKKNDDLKIIYSPIHGTGYKIIPMILSHFGFSNTEIVKEQSTPDGNFPTVKYPNPEEKEALTMSLDLAEKNNADVVVATDPDSDRMGVAFRGNDGEFLLPNGNQIGTMLEYYILTRLKEENRLPANSAVIKTIVTTELQREIAESFNCSVYDVLTGFKWIASKMDEFENTGESKFVFGGEESFGYLPVDFVRDKDAVSSVYFFIEMTSWLKKKGMTPADFLDEIYLKYSLYYEELYSMTLKGMEGNERIRRIMKEFRKSPPESFADVKINKLSDYQSLTAKNMITGELSIITDLPDSNVLQFFLEDGSKITMRPSGTEPKIKFYFSVNKKVNIDNIDENRNKLKQKVKDLQKNFISQINNIK